MIVWQVISHKFLRPLVPFFMLGALLANIVLVMVRWPSGLAGWRAVYILLLAGQIGFYLLAGLGKQMDRDTKLGKMLYLPVW
jgi:hypothetical protein